MKTLITILVFLSLTLITEAQDTSSASTGKNIYRKAWHAGFLIHTHGIGGHYRAEKFRGSRMKNFFQLELYNIKHSKETKSFSSANDQSNSFIFGKMNHLFVFKAGVGQQRIIFEKLVTQGVQISTVYSANIIFGLLKPVYVDVIKFDDKGQTISTEQYDPNIHHYDIIDGRGPFLKGFSNAKFVPGIGLKFGLNFEFAPTDDKIKALEIGINADGFMEPMPIMAFNRQYNIHVNMYLNFQFGRKSYL